MSPHKRGPNKKNLLIQSTVGKRAKRMLDPTVKTTQAGNKEQDRQTNRALTSTNKP